LKKIVSEKLSKEKKSKEREERKIKKDKDRKETKPTFRSQPPEKRFQFVGQLCLLELLVAGLGN
jgi:hypothetical protein